VSFEVCAAWQKPFGSAWKGLRLIGGADECLRPVCVCHSVWLFDRGMPWAPAPQSVLAEGVSNVGCLVAELTHSPATPPKGYVLMPDVVL